MNSQAVLERRKRGGLTTKLSSEQISCIHNRKKMGVFVENQIKTLIMFVADQTKESVEKQIFGHL